MIYIRYASERCCQLILQLKVIAIDDGLTVFTEFAVEYDSDLKEFKLGILHVSRDAETYPLQHQWRPACWQ